MQNFTLTFHVFTYNINSSLASGATYTFAWKEKPWATCKKFSFRFFDNFLQDFLHQEGKN